MDVREKLVELCEDLETLLCCDTYEAQADYLIAKGVTVQEWISVKDRLPERSGSVLVYDYEKGKDVFWYNDNCFHIIDEYGYAYPVKTVTHWMPLPEPPED